MTSIQEYYDAPALNQSFLKSLLDDVYSVRQPKEEEGEVKQLRSDHALIIGSAVDCLVTDPEDWVNYYVVNSDIPTGQMMKFIETVVHIMRKKSTWMFTKIPPENVLSDAYEVVGIKSRTFKTVCKKFFEEHYDLYLELVENYDKTWLPSQDFKLVETIATNVTNHPYTRSIFNNNYEKLFQVAIYFQFEGVDCKALLDILLIDHENKRIMPYDLKTTKEYPSQFGKAIDQHRYDIQAMWYTLALEEEFAELIAAGYTIEPFTFVVASKKDPTCPIQVPLKFGNPDKMIEELKRLVSKYKYYEENGYDVDMDIALNSGVMPINKCY